MSEAKLYLDHRRLYSKFYEAATRRHANSSQLSGRLRALLQRVEVPAEEGDKMYLRTVQPRKFKDESPLNEMQSLRITSSSSKNALDASKSKVSRRSDSSRERDRAEGESRFFGTDWVYSSGDQSRVYVFAMLASFVLTDNSVGLFKLEDRMNEEMGRSQAIPPILMISVSKYWQRVVEVVTKKKSYLWEKHLREPLDRMPYEFIKLVARVVAGGELEGGRFSREEAGRLAKQGKMGIANFGIYCREIEFVEREGTSANEIIMGYLRHRNTYVIANKIPEYSESEVKHRKAKAFMQQGLRSLLAQYRQDQQELATLEDLSVPNEKEKVARQFLARKLAALRPN